MKQHIYAPFVHNSIYRRETATFLVETTNEIISR